MICPQCSTQNDDDYVFCVNCGTTIGDRYKTVKYSSETVQEPLPPTVYVKEAEYRPQPAPFVSEPTFERYPTPSSASKIPLIVGLVVILMAAAGGLALLISRQNSAVVEDVEIFPQYLGLFLKSEKGQPPIEVKRFDISNGIEGRNNLLNDPQLPKVSPKPDFVLYADPADIPLSGLKLVRLDTITDDGRSRHAEYQAAIIDERPAMKRIMLPQPLSSGRYAFVVYSGFFNEGSHRFWPFEVSGGDANGMKFEQEIALSIKPIEPAPGSQGTPSPAVTAPAGATIAYCNATDVRIRSGSNKESKILGKLKKNQKVFVLDYNDIEYMAKGMDKWAFVQTEEGKQGWVFDAYLSYGQK